MRYPVVLLTVISLMFMLTLTLPITHGSEENIKAEIIFDNVFGLYGFELKVAYDPNTLDLVAVTPQLPWTFYHIVKNELDEQKGVYRLVAVALPPSSPYSGTTKVAELVFLPFAGAADIHIAEAKLVDKNGNSIPFKVDGLILRGIPVHDVAAKKVLACPRSAYQGDPITVSVEVENQGDFEETFDVAVYADQDGSVIGDEIVVGEKTVSMLPKSTMWLTFIWDTTWAPYGGYYISVKLSIVSGENDVSDNFLDKADYVGGIYPRPHVRRNAEILAQVFLTSILGLAIFAGAFCVKNYWFSC
ncbi:MAG: hypothetical protein NZ932_06535 [Candidatus Bathyarchaeota archaeon]|nr:hypothetical protein [Candidatus Bathyarchaeota archaeon]